MKQHPDEAQLNEYVDGVLDLNDRAFIETHCAGCDACRAEVEAMRALAAAVRQLPTHILPERDLRGEIAEHIGRVPSTNIAVPSRRPRMLVMAAAAAVLVIATATLTRWWVQQDATLVSAAQDRSPPSARQAGPGVDGPAAQREGSPVLIASFRTEETRYLDAIADLQHTLDRERSELAPQTIAILEQNLTIIDRAIAESRAALEEDPANRNLSRMVLSVYEQKLQLLQRARVSAL